MNRIVPYLPKIKNHVWSLAIVISLASLIACREDADSFFSGRPSGMAMLHNKALDGQVDSMVNLLRVAQRYHDASNSQRKDWQRSIIAWWNTPNGQSRILNALDYLSEVQLQNLEDWVRTPRDQLTKQEIATLDSFAKMIDSFRTSSSGKASVPSKK